MKKFLSLTAALLVATLLQGAQGPYSLKSPDGKIAVCVCVGKDIQYSVSKSGEQIIAPSPISMTLGSGATFGKDDKVSRRSLRSVDQTLSPIIYKKAQVRDNYNELRLAFKQFNLIFRAYDQGVAYRFEANLKSDFLVSGEKATFNFPEDYYAYIPYSNAREGASIEEQVNCSFENIYSPSKVSEFDPKRIAFAPVTLRSDKGTLLCITESDLLNYPGMFLRNNAGKTSLEGYWAHYPDEVEIGGHNMLQGVVKSRFSYLAKASAKEKFPWRIIAIASRDKDLLSCDLPWLLGSPCKEETAFSWVKPGKVAWDWWNDWNLYGVDFKAGINNETYKYYIDFASSHGIQYVILDEGWAVNLKTDLFQVVPEIDLPMLCSYAENKGVGLILWAGYKAFEKDLEKVCREYSAMGVKGFKVDFMDRDDQQIISFYAKAAETAAKYHLLLDFHGTSKPAGLQRTYPNVINFEGVHGLEQLKWGKRDQVTYDVTIPFARMVAGPMDYTQGAMRNATKGNYRPVNSEAMSQGTRCRQLAEYVVFESPLNMLCDSPSNYMAEPECTKFIAECPETWDEVVPLEGKIGEYVALARRKGNTWYIGALTDWNSRELELDLSFLKGARSVEIFQDGPNADRAARDFKHLCVDFPQNGILKAAMAPGGGFAAIIK